jgi:hypothetical protein
VGSRLRWIFRRPRHLVLIAPIVVLLGVPLVLHSQLQQVIARFAEPGCPSSGAVFTVAPTDSNAFAYLVPLGNLSPPDHTTPTDHIYYVFPGDMNQSPPPVTSIRAPSRIHIGRVSHITAIVSGRVRSHDYKVDFSPCRGVDAYFDHITGLSPALGQAVSAAGARCDEYHPRPSDTYRYCNSNLDYVAQAGEVIGQAGGGTAAGFDFGATDDRSPTMAYVNPARYNNQLHVVCPFDLFVGSLRDSFLTRFGRTGSPRTIAPVCGTAMQDQAGTAQGNWFVGNVSAGSPEGWSKSLALVHDNFDPRVGVVSFGGNGGGAFRLDFIPTRSGTINREFSGITPGHEVYCFESVGQRGQQTSTQSSSEPARRVLIQLVSATRLLFEAQAGSCSSTFAFVSSTTYSR